MNSAKTATLLMHLYNIQDTQSPILLKPSIDTRDGELNLRSRIGINRDVNFLIYSDTDLCLLIQDQRTNHIFVDEVQFLTVNQINQLRVISMKVNVSCFGLKTDYRSNLFPASRRLLEIADKFKEIKTRCSCCFRKAVMTAKFKMVISTDRFGVIDSKKIYIRETENDDVIDIGGEDKYQSLCWRCYNK
jgi:thymidine kinase